MALPDFFRSYEGEKEIMIRAKLWFRCAGAFNPVTPVVWRPAVIGWKAREKQIDFAIERAFNGEELISRMKGWVTADVKMVIKIVKRHGYLKMLDEQDLVVEMETEEDFENLKNDLTDSLQDHIDLERI
jgi:hypothetical protein